MARRFHVEQVRPGQNRLGRDASHHAKTVLRLQPGDAVELFDDAGHTGRGTILKIDGDTIVAQIDDVATAVAGIAVHIASAVPKASRADWMIEKLSELGVSRFTPLATERAVVLPEGTGKRDRWRRIAEEAARQSGRAGVMEIDPLTKLDAVVSAGRGWFCSTAPPADPLLQALANQPNPVTLLIGPEGDWSPGEIARMKAAGWQPVTLGGTILRVETAAIVAAVLAMNIKQD